MLGNSKEGRIGSHPLRWGHGVTAWCWYDITEALWATEATLVFTLSGLGSCWEGFEQRSDMIRITVSEINLGVEKILVEDGWKQKQLGGHRNGPGKR